MSLTANLVGFGWVWTLLGALFIALMMYLASEANMQRFLHLLQLESYQLDGYEAPSLLLTPHTAGGYNHMEATLERIKAIFLDNLRRYVEGRTLRNQVR